MLFLKSLFHKALSGLHRIIDRSGTRREPAKLFFYSVRYESFLEYTCILKKFRAW